MYPGGFTVCAWFAIDKEAQNFNKQNFPNNPIIDAERFGMYVWGDVQEGTLDANGNPVFSLQYLTFYVRDGVTDANKKKVT